MCVPCFPFLFSLANTIDQMTGLVAAMDGKRLRYSDLIADNGSEQWGTVMNTCRIAYRKGEGGLKLVRADSVNGLQSTSDSYVFKMENEIVAVMPKAVVVSFEKVSSGESVE